MNTTTKNALQANGGIGIVVYLALTVLRAFVAIPWGTEVDAMAACAIAASIGPFLSRKLAFLRDPSKPERGAMLDIFEQALNKADPEVLGKATEDLANRVKVLTKLEPKPEKDPVIRKQVWKMAKDVMQAAIDAKKSAGE